MIVLGIDPGTATTGFGIIKGIKTKRKKTKKIPFRCLDYGIISTPKNLTRAERFKILNKKLNKIIKTYQPDILVVESLYFFKNLKTAIAVSEAKGVILLTAAKKKIPICEISPLEAKLAITGYGRAEKKLIQEKIKKLLSLKEIPKPDDAADALAVALCFFKNHYS